MDTFATIVLYLLAAIGALTIVSSVGVFVMTWRLTDPDPDVAEIVAAHTQTFRSAHQELTHVRILPGETASGATHTMTPVPDMYLNVRHVDRYQHDLGPACALCGSDHSPASAS